jgi:hypothetical protein
MAIPSGLNVVVDSQGGTANAQYVRFIGYGTYTAADFTIGPEATYSGETQLTYGGLGFTPKMVKATSLTTGLSSLGLTNSNLTKDGYTQVAAGDKTPVENAGGFSVSGKNLTVDVSVVVIASNDDFIIECWG